jgi:hypothetical protein
VTEAELNAEFAARIGSFEQDGARITSGSVGVTESNLVLHVTIFHEPTGRTISATVHGVPGVSDGRATFGVTAVTVTDGVHKSLRGLAEAMMREAMAAYLASHGIPLPADNLYLERIELRPGIAVLHGRRR